jgi:subtilisin family serine protease
MVRRGLVFVLVCLVLTAGTAYAAAPNDPGWSQQWHLRTIHADRAWTRSKGAGIVVAVVDTGVDLSHPDLHGRLVGGIDLVDPGTSPDDEDGHGTFMAGLIAADTGNVEGVASVAPLAKIMPVRALDERGIGEPSVVAKGIRYAADHGAKVINLSLAQEPIEGGSSAQGNLFADKSIGDAIEYAAGKGAVVVAAAGNNFDLGGVPATSYDATVDGVIVVGASTKRDRRAAYSNYGSGLDVLAPGGGSSTAYSKESCQANSPIVSTWWNKSTGSAAYGAGCGTSMAVAHVSGIAALLRARGFSNGSTVARIKNTAVDLYSPGRDNQSGYGRVDSAAAVGATAVAVKPKPRSGSGSRPRPVGAAGGAKPAVKGTKFVPPPAAAPIQNLSLTSAGPFGSPLDPKLHLIAFALALAIGVGVAQVMARRRVREDAVASS